MQTNHLSTSQNWKFNITVLNIGTNVSQDIDTVIKLYLKNIFVWVEYMTSIASLNPQEILKSKHNKML